MENSSLNLSEIQFGPAVSYFRKERKMDIFKLAMHSDLTPEILKKIESDELHPTEEILLRITTALDIPLQVFVLEATLRTPSESKEEESTRATLLPVFNFLTRRLILE